MAPIVEFGRRKYEVDGEGGGHKNINHRPPHFPALMKMSSGKDRNLGGICNDRERLSREAIDEIVVKMAEAMAGEVGERSTAR